MPIYKTKLLSENSSYSYTHFFRLKRGVFETNRIARRLKIKRQRIVSIIRRDRRFRNRTSLHILLFASFYFLLFSFELERFAKLLLVGGRHFAPDKVREFLFRSRVGRRRAGIVFVISIVNVDFGRRVRLRGFISF